MDNINQTNYTANREYSSHQTEDNRSIGQVVSDLLADVSTLFRQEVELAKTEMTQKASRAVGDVVSAIVGGVVLYTGVIVLIAALVIGLTAAFNWALWLSALLVGGVISLVGAIFLAKGIKDLRQLSPTPKRTIRTVKEDARYIKEKVQNG